MYLHTLAVVLSVGSPIIAFEIVSLPLNSVYWKHLGKQNQKLKKSKTKQNIHVLSIILPVPSHLTVLHPVANIRMFKKEREISRILCFIDFSVNRQLDGEDRIKILNLKNKQLQLSPISVLRSCPINSFDWPGEVIDYLEPSMVCVCFLSLANQSGNRHRTELRNVCVWNIKKS